MAATWDDGQTACLITFLTSLPGLQQAKILRTVLASESLLTSHFRPFSPDCPALVPQLLTTARAAGVRLERLTDRFYADLLAAVVKEEDEETDVNREVLLEVMATVQLLPDQLRQLVDQLTGLPLHQLVRRGVESAARLSRQGLLLCGALSALALTSSSGGDSTGGVVTATERLSVAMEHLLAQVDRADSLPATSLTSYLTRWPATADQLSENLFYVCCAQLASQPIRGEP